MYTKIGWQKNYFMFASKLQMGSTNRTFAVFFSLIPRGLPRRFKHENSSGMGAGGIFPTASSLVPPGLFLPLVVLSDPDRISWAGVVWNSVSNLAFRIWGFYMPKPPKHLFWRKKLAFISGGNRNSLIRR